MSVEQEDAANEVDTTAVEQETGEAVVQVASASTSCQPQDPVDADDDSRCSRVTAFVFKWIFPIYKHELIKVIPVIIMMLAALFVYAAYRDIKDSMVFMEERQSLITVQWCKVLVFFVSIPTATLFMKLANVVSRDFIFYQACVSCYQNQEISRNTLLVC